jgi:hypothetical protein
MLDTFSGNIQPHSIEDEIKDSFLSYAMSVIVSAPCPDVRDGLKPVHRASCTRCTTSGCSRTALPQERYGSRRGHR